MKRLLYTLLPAIFLVSCTEEVEIELDSTYARLVVFGSITTDTLAHEIELKKSADYFFNQPAEKISDAIVELSFADTSFQLNEHPEKPGIYHTQPDFFGVPGETYHLTVNGVDIDEDGSAETYEASSFLPPVNPIDSITLMYTANSFFAGWEIQVWTYDPAGIENFYIFKARINGVLVTDTLTEYVIQNDEFFDGNYTYGITSQFLMESGDQVLEPGDVVTFEANGITEEYYTFLFEAQTEAFGQNPLFSGPPANVKSNISNDALGFFTAYSVSRSSKVVPEDKPTGD
jgi:hypothetical protein